MMQPREHWWPMLGRRPDLPTYVGGWLASLAWLAVVGSTVGATSFNALIFFLTTLGFAFSFWLRGFAGGAQWDTVQRVVLVPSAVLRFAVMAFAIVPGLLGKPPFEALIPDMAMGDEEWLIGTGFMWAMALYSFGLVSDGLVAFGSVLGLSMLGLMASSNVNPEIGVAFLAYLLGNILMLSNMTLAHHTRRRPTGQRGFSLARWFGDQLIVAGLTVTVTTVLAIGLAAVLGARFAGLLVPRLRLPGALAGGSALASGWASFKDQIELGVGEGVTSTAPVFEIRSQEPLLWRRRVYDRYWGRIWTATRGDRFFDETTASAVDVPANVQAAAALRATRAVEQEIHFLADAELAAAPLITRIGTTSPGGLGRIEVDGYNDVRVSFRRGTVVRVTSQVPAPNPDQLRATGWVERSEYRNLLTVPVTAQATVLPVARALVAGLDNPYDAAVALERYLQTQFTYDLAVRVPPAADDAMEHYFQVKRGACDLIATAMALMARSVGIPARVASGYLTGDELAGGSWLVRLSHAHAWTELYFEGYGWVAFNPVVPADAAGNVAATGGEDAASRLALGRANLLRLATFLLLGWLLYYVARQWRAARPTFESTPPGRVGEAWYLAQRQLQRRRLARRAHETPREHYLRLAAGHAGAALLPALARLTELYERVRYGLGAVTQEDAAAAGESLRTLRRLLRRRR